MLRIDFVYFPYKETCCLTVAFGLVVEDAAIQVQQFALTPDRDALYLRLDKATLTFRGAGQIFF